MLSDFFAAGFSAAFAPGNATVGFSAGFGVDFAAAVALPFRAVGGAALFTGEGSTLALGDIAAGAAGSCCAVLLTSEVIEGAAGFTGAGAGAAGAAAGLLAGSIPLNVIGS